MQMVHVGDFYFYPMGLVFPLAFGAGFGWLAGLAVSRYLDHTLLRRSRP